MCIQFGGGALGVVLGVCDVVCLCSRYLVLTSSPSRNGMASSVRRTLPTVLFPHPAGPVTIQICCISAGLGVEDVTPLVPLVRSGMMRALLTVESTTGVWGGCGRSPAESML